MITQEQIDAFYEKIVIAALWLLAIVMILIPLSACCL